MSATESERLLEAVRGVAEQVATLEAHLLGELTAFAVAVREQAKRDDPTDPNLSRWQTGYATRQAVADLYEVPTMNAGRELNDGLHLDLEDLAPANDGTPASFHFTGTDYGDVLHYTLPADWLDDRQACMARLTKARDARRQQASAAAMLERLERVERLRAEADSIEAAIAQGHDVARGATP